MSQTRVNELVNQLVIQCLRDTQAQIRNARRQKVRAAMQRKPFLLESRARLVLGGQRS